MNLKIITLVETEETMNDSISDICRCLHKQKANLWLSETYDKTEKLQMGTRSFMDMKKV